jgi:hypothetical protein
MAAGSPLQGQQAWSGDLGSFQDVIVDLSAYTGQSLLLRWRFVTDLSNGDEGWYVDDVRLEDVNHVCPPPPVRRNPGARCPSGQCGGRPGASRGR